MIKTENNVLLPSRTVTGGGGGGENIHILLEVE